MCESAGKVEEEEGGRPFSLFPPFPPGCLSTGPGKKRERGRDSTKKRLFNQSEERRKKNLSATAAEYPRRGMHLVGQCCSFGSVLCPPHPPRLSSLVRELGGEIEE